ncbi:MAG: BON domain-containing protein [Candidatus Scalindua sp.]|nr:BON domain-containing protein [Candidatus Scalindua sp.]
MKKQIFFGILTILMLIITRAMPLFAVENTTTDSDINYWVRDALRHDERTDASNIVVNSHDGIVTLSGEVTNLAAKNYADKEAKKIKGVLAVINEIIVKPQFRPDSDIRNAVRRRILNSAVIKSEHIEVSAVDGRIILSGVVSSWSEALEAVTLASEVRGVKEVKNDITPHWKIERSDDEIKNDVMATLKRDVYLNGLPIKVSVNNGVVFLTGSVGNAYEKERAKNDIGWISQVKGIKNDIEIKWFMKRGTRMKEPSPSDIELKKSVLAELSQDSRVNSSDITVKSTSGHVTLDGSVKTFYEKNIAVKDANDVVGVGFVTNNLSVREEIRSDKFIQEDVDFNFDTDYTLGGFDIATKVKDGIVTLTGEVHTLYQKSHARDVASRISGVKKIINRIAVHRTSWKTDVELTSQIKARLNLNAITWAVSANISVSVKNRAATLTGDVDTWSERREAGRVAFLTEDIWKVDNRITVKGHDYPWDEWHDKGTYEYDPYYDYYLDPFGPLYDNFYYSPMG